MFVGENSFKSKFGMVFDIFKRSVESSVRLRTEEVPSAELSRLVTVDTYFLHGHRRPWFRHYPVVLFNDGQDLRRMNFWQILTDLYQAGKLPPAVFVGLHASHDRMREYGTAYRPDYQNRGDRAALYERFVLRELLPLLRHDFRTQKRLSVAGFSLGGLNAFDLAWRNPDIFDRAGIFSGSFWWRAQPFRSEAPDADLIVPTLIEATPARPRTQQFWFQTGTLDEDSDRNHNGVIDSIDDTLHVMAKLQQRGYRTGVDLKYVEMEGGRHDVPTWGRAMPEFLQWALAKR